MKEIIIKFVGTLITGLKLSAGALVGRVMAAIGLTWVNFTYVLPEVKTWIAAQAAGLPGDVANFMAACGIDVFIIMIISAVVAKAGMRTMTTSLSSIQGLIGAEAGT